MEDKTLSKNCENSCKKTSIGGQALIEGVMMRGVGKAAMAVRMPDGTIDVEIEKTKLAKDKSIVFRMPFVRGIFNFIDNMIFGYKYLMKSAEKSGMDLEESESKFDKWLEKHFGDKLMKVVSGIAMVLGLVLAVGLFVLAPMGIVWLIEQVVTLNGTIKTLIEGLIKIAVFVAYLALVSQTKDIKRVFEYHGAEHKSIACYEAGEELTVENVKKHKRFHPRCGTSFLLIVLIVSILVYSVIQFSWENLLLRAALKILLLPVIVGISYEIIKLAGRYDNIFTRILSAPGLWIQRFTTREPDDSQIEVAIASLKPVLPEENENDNW